MGLPQTRTEAAEALKKYGQQRYIDGDYEGALAAFNEALILCDSDSVGVLDSRAATYCKLGKLQKALEDGRRMIKLKRHDHRGYLRTAIVLRFMKKPDKARDILRYALRTLPMDSTFYKDVVRAEKNVSAALHGPQTFDPSSVLPFEVMRMIMLQLSIQDRILLRRVSRPWRVLCQSMPELYRNLDCRLAPKRKPLSAKSILTFLKLSNCSPVQATLTRLPPMEARKALEYLSRCDSLQELGLDCPSDQWHEIFTPTKFRNLRSLNVCSDAPVTPTNMRRLCYSLPQLEHLQFWAIDDNFGGTQDAFPAVMPHLRSLTINGWKASEPVAALCKPDMATRLPALETFYMVSTLIPDVFDFSKCTNLRRFGLIGCSCPHRQRSLLLLPDGLEHVSFSGTHQFFDTANWQPRSLKSLLWNGGWIVSNTLRNLLTRFCRDLVYLDLEGTLEWSTYEVFLESIQNGCLQSVVDLNVARVPEVTYNAVDLIAKYMPNLKRLDISATSLDGSSILKLAIADKLKLEKLTCHGLLTERSYHDAVQFARNRGIDIPIVKREVPKSGLRKCAL